MRSGFLASTLLTFAALASAQSNPPSVYAPPELPSEADGTNQGAVNLDVNINYMTEYVYRGIKLFEDESTSDRVALQLGSKLEFNLGKLPHPFIELFANINENDPISNFQEIRPTVGFDWTIKPLVFTGGHTSYIYPDRDQFETSEVFLKVAMDDNVLISGWRIPMPYALAAYDYDLYDGVYLEAGLKYKLNFEDYGLSIAFTGSASYINGYESQIKDQNGGFINGIYSNALTDDETINGFQRWQVGAEATYSLNKLFEVSNRYGEWNLKGYLWYTEDLDDQIAADTLVWGGAGIEFKY